MADTAKAASCIPTHCASSSRSNGRYELLSDGKSFSGPKSAGHMRPLSRFHRLYVGIIVCDAT